MHAIGIIPARMASLRFPGKPLEKICGIPMIGHVYHRSKMSGILSEVYIATCDKEIMEYADSIRAPAVMTNAFHERASDRAAEAMQKIEKEQKKKIDIVVMIQGDEPMIAPSMIDDAIRAMQNDPNIQVVNLMSRLDTQEEHEDPNEVKVVVDQQNFALYFSREPIPSRKRGALQVPMLKQVCIIPFRRDFLLHFNNMAPTPLEVIESVDMLRVLEHGFKVKMVMSDHRTYSVDTPDDLECVNRYMENDVLMEKYIHNENLHGS
jgi:3-deoxy-manno-octulosonate cytidylyltransferase (CMP-KDO synthetase)